MLPEVSAPEPPHRRYVYFGRSVKWPDTRDPSQTFGRLKLPWLQPHHLPIPGPYQPLSQKTNVGQKAF